jgi:hypothetical protein
VISRNRPSGQGRAPKVRWECSCCDPPILLARYDPGGKVQIKIRDRFYMASGCVHATCPRCGTHHILDLRPAPSTPDVNGTRSEPGSGPVPAPTGGGWW